MADLTYESFYNYEQMTHFLMQLQENHREWMKVDSIGQSEEGRHVYVVTVTDPATGSAKEKGAYYIQAGLHAIEGAGVTAALHTLQALVTEKRFRELLKYVAFYIVPCVDPDGMNYTLTMHKDLRSRLATTHKINELQPQDVDGDGFMLQMRWKDPFGPFKPHPKDPRLMIRRKFGDEEGPFYQVVREGVISNYDPSLPIQNMRVVDFNRTYPVNWKHDSATSAYPFSAPEMRAVADFQVNHPNIFAGVDFHCGTHAILRPNFKTDSQFHRGDLKQIIEVGKLAESITGFPLMGSEYNFDYTPMMMPGTSNDWAYAKLGISHYIVEVGFGLTTLGLKPEEILSSSEEDKEEFRRRLLALHDERKNQVFSPWKKFNHPQLGEVEIGGLMQGNARLMDPKDMIDVVPKTTEFIFQHANMRPQLVIPKIETMDLGNRIYRIRAVIGNLGGFSTEIMRAGGSADMKYPVTVKLELDHSEVLSYSQMKQVSSLPELGGSPLHVEWFVQLKEERKKISLKASHPRAGTVREFVDLS